MNFLKFRDENQTLVKFRDQNSILPKKEKEKEEKNRLTPPHQRLF